MRSYVSLPLLKDQLKIAGMDTVDDARLRRAAEAATRTFEQLSGQRFQPYTATRYLTPLFADAVWLESGLLSVTELATLTTNSAGTRTYGDVWATTDYDLSPDEDPFDMRPYEVIRTNPGGRYAFSRVARSLKVEGLWGWWLDTQAAGTLGAAIADATTTSVTMTGGHTVEALQTLLIGTEQLYVQSVSTNALTVVRGVNGTTAAAHDNGVAVSVYQYPADVSQATALQTVRNYRRHEAPFGITGSSETGSMRVMPVDPDVMLVAGDYSRLMVGAV